MVMWWLCSGYVVVVRDCVLLVGVVCGWWLRVVDVVQHV